MKFLVSFLALCAASLVVATQGNHRNKYPIGINLGPTHLTAAYYNSSNDLVIIGKVEASDTYKKFYSDFVIAESQKPEPVGLDDHAQDIFKFGPAMNESEIEGMFTEALMSIRARCEEILGQDRLIAAVVMPSEWQYERELREAVLSAEEKALGFIRPSLQTRGFMRVARLHYGLDHRPGLWGEPSKREVMVLLIEFEKAYLRVKVLEIDYGVEDVLVDELWMDLGEVNYDASFEESRADNYSIELGVALKSSVREQEIELLDGIIISGEASAPAQAFLQSALIGVLPSLNHSKILNSTDPFYLGAVGAADWARQLYDDPEWLSSDTGTSHGCFDDAGTCYYDSQEYRDDVAQERREISEYFGFPYEDWPKSNIYP